MAYILPQLLTETACHFPKKDAVACGEGVLSYGALDSLSNRLGRTLRKHGVRRGDRVGIHLSKSLASVISVFGILKADAVYVPLDPSAPIPRLAYVVRDCGIRCLLSTPDRMAQVTRLASDGSPIERVLLMDGSGSGTAGPAGLDLVRWQEIVEQAHTPLDLQNIETDLAYILYTSGSTGNPKGVMITHLNALTFVHWACQAVRLRPDDRVSNHAPLHFDLSIFDIFSGVKAGATVCVVPSDVAKFPIAVADFMARQRISVWYSVPSVWVHMLSRGEIDHSALSTLRTIIFAGEVFPTKYLRRLMALLPQAEFFNWYGPTETNVVTSYQVKSLPCDDTQTIPIGKPCTNMEVFVIDSEGRLVAEAGATGELYARGSTVAQGYWNDRTQTDNRFLRNPLQAQFLDRVYRTGDLVMLDHEGNYRYQGRRDHQVKVDGYRIELGEVEAAILGHPDVVQAAVLALQTEEQRMFLKAFVVPRSDRTLTESDIKRHCGRYVPKYMIPQVVEIRDGLPETSTGKVAKPVLAAEPCGPQGFSISSENAP